MKKKNFAIASLLLCLSLSTFGQEEQEAQKSTTIDSQFTSLIEKSNTYQSYKVIKISELGILQRNIRDSISSLKSTIADSESIITEQNNKINSSTQQVDALNTDLEQTQKNVENISFLGIATQKSSYKTIMWALVGILLFISIFLFFRFKKSGSDTKEAKEKLSETEIELDNLRKRSLEREQKVRRQLQDEINKNKMK